jgi:hypothetical protein
MNELPFHLALNPFVNEAVSADRETDEARPNDEVDTADIAPLVPQSRPDSEATERPEVVVVPVTFKDEVALIVPNVPFVAVSIEPVLRVVVAPEFEKKFTAEDVVAIT